MISTAVRWRNTVRIRGEKYNSVRAGGAVERKMMQKQVI